MRNLQAPGRSPVIAPNGMASTSHSLATEAAVAMLRSGGNAMDAALTACAVQAVIEPGSTGIGGDCFCLYAPAGSTNIVAFNGSGRAPLKNNLSWFQEQGITKITQTMPHAVTIPGAVDAWFQLNRDHGQKSLADILQPAINYARDGYPVGQRIAFDFAAAYDVIKSDPDTAALFLNNGEPYKIGQRHHQPALAKTLETIAAHGRDGFYKGAVADDILGKLNSLGGLHTQADFDTAIGDYVTPIKTRYRDYDIWECPPNGQGVFALLLLNIMAQIPTFGDNPLTPKRIHHEIEAGRLVYRDRSLYLGDPAFGSIPVEELLSSEYADTLRAAINPDIATAPLPDLSLPPHKSTVYISVVDKDRNVCSLINTVFHGFGSGILAPKSGVLLQNRGMGFVLDPTHPNCIAPGKRPLHTIIPGMATYNGKAVMPFGVMGGDYQAFGHMQFLTRLLDYGMDVQQAQDIPRFFANPHENFVEVENTIASDTREALIKMGHNIVEAKTPIGGSQAIWIDEKEDMLHGGSDPRKDGCAIGY
ncbi:gamma-glutamyltransferase [uncultured Candidatus Puniceispirillum sp.]|uniref:gamma-glutamyltransferase n=1 Tax=uncultured Candidatus Puniceispirillum sp. TaxID=1985115 RepID=UPI0032B1B7A0